jgi:hypothetical protein
MVHQFDPAQLLALANQLYGRASRPRRPGWNPVRRSVSRSLPRRFTCTMRTPSAIAHVTQGLMRLAPFAA